MNKTAKIGRVPWTRKEMINKLEEFSLLYEKRPIKDNSGGMGCVHMFYIWFALSKLKPKAIVESGVWLGQGTWFFEKACPNAKIFCLEPVIDRIVYKSKHAEYIQEDFSNIDWSDLPKDESLLFFDDHQNAYERVKTAYWFNLKNIIFEDNYPPLKGDCYSIKKVLMNAGFNPSGDYNFKQQVKSLFLKKQKIISPNKAHEKYLRKKIEVYYEFPPVYKSDLTRWGDKWSYPTPEPLLTSVASKYQKRFKNEAKSYTWMCFLKLK